jgi:EpsI family protein
MTIPGLGTTGGNNLVIWHWYRIGGRYTDNPNVARLLGVWSNFVEGRSDAALIVVATPYEQDPAQGDAVLGEFIERMLPEIETELEKSRNNAAKRSTALRS